jgi:hypothetical protein
MAETVKAFASAVAFPTAETVGLLLYGSIDQDTALSALPTAPQIGARTVRIRGTLVVVAAPTTGPITIICRRGQTTAGTQVQNSVISAAIAIGQPVPFEFVDTAPVLPALNYAITVTTAAGGAGTYNITAELEEVN